MLDVCQVVIDTFSVKILEHSLKQYLLNYPTRRTRFLKIFLYLQVLFKATLGSSVGRAADS